MRAETEIIVLSGTNSYTGVNIDAWTALMTNVRLILNVSNPNTITAPTLTLDGLTSKPIVAYDGSLIGIGNLSGLVEVMYNGTSFQVLGGSNKNLATNRQTASYTLILTDNGLVVEMNVASSNNLTVPANTTVAFPIGTQILVTQYGVGQTIIVPAAGVTINSTNGYLKLNTKFSGASLLKIATNEWYLFGSITN